MKTGLREFSPQPTDIAVGSVWSPPETAAEGGVRDLEWGVLGNDDWGDCYWASAAHEFMAIRHRVDAAPEFSDQSVLDAYGTYLGLYGRAGLEANPDADAGTDARDGARYRRDHGIADDKGHQHYIGAYAFESDPYQLPALIDAFGAVTVCVNLTTDAERAFSIAEQEKGDFTWDIGSLSPTVGGHAIAGTYWTPGGIGVVSWGREGIITYDYLEHYMQTAVVYFSRGELDSNGETPAGLDKEKLVGLVKEVRSQ